MLQDIALDGEVFDEDLFAYFEDVDLDWRAQLRGYRCCYTPNARGAHVRGGTGLIEKPEVAALYLSNRFLILLKNDTLRDLLADIGPILLRSVRDLCEYVRKSPAAIPRAFWRFLRLAPRMLSKRGRSLRRRAVSREYIRSMRVKTSFLG
jgi:GT2 family glycosyltransferase